MNGDVTVLGMQPGTCMLDDIGLDIPHGASVTIPADKAARSRDLWRCISQRLLFQLNAGATVVQRAAANPFLAEVEDLRARNSALTEENRVLKATVAQLQAGQQTKLDTILGLLQTGAVMSPPARTEALPGPVAARAVAAVVEVAPPPFVPSKIRPDDVGATHVQAETESSDGDVAETASRLRELRRRQ